jgi:hypothetical protein
MILNLFAPIAIAASMLLASSAYAQEDQNITDAKAAATAWLALADAGQYPATWTSGASAFQAAVSQDNWLQALQQVRTPLGAVKTRTLKSAQLHAQAKERDVDMNTLVADLLAKALA